MPPEPHGRVIDAHARLRIDDFDHGADHIGGRVELARLLAGRVGKVLDQVFVGSAEQIGEFEVLVAQGDLLEDLDEVDQACRRSSVRCPILRLKLMCSSTSSSWSLLCRSSSPSAVLSPLPTSCLQMADGCPARFRGHVKRVLVPTFEQGLEPIAIKAAGAETGRELLALLVEQVAAPLQEQNAENVFLVLRGIHVAAKLVARLEEEAGELGKGEFGHVGR